MCSRWYLYVISRCSDRLEKLTIYTDWFAGSFGDVPSVKLTIADSELSGLKELVLDCCWEDDELPDWDWLWKRSNNVEGLEMKTSKYTHLQDMASCIALYFPKVNSFVFKHDKGYMTGQDLASLISACRGGWRSLRTVVALDRFSCEALTKHCATLEELQVTNISEYSSRTLRHILSSSPRLRVLITSDDTRYDERRVPYLDAEHFIDAHQGTLNPWPCEATLKVLRTKITRIPRPDVTKLLDGRQHVDASKKTCIRKGRRLQKRIYERLSRFTNLEELCLGNGTIVRREPYYPVDAVGEDYQYECLEMTLETGLHQMKGLKKLRVLDIRSMAQRIGVKEVQWMALHWPTLKVLRGLCDDGDNIEAARWLWKNFPMTTVEVFSRAFIAQQF